MAIGKSQIPINLNKINISLEKIKLLKKGKYQKIMMRLY